MDSMKVLCVKYKEELTKANEEKLIALANVDILKENVNILNEELKIKDDELAKSNDEIERLRARIEELEVRFDIDPNEVVEEIDEVISSRIERSNQII